MVWGDIISKFITCFITVFLIIASIWVVDAASVSKVSIGETSNTASPSPNDAPIASGVIQPSQPSQNTASATVPSYYMFSTSAAYHNDYGLAYPVTFEFSIPADSSNLKAYKMYTTSGTWSQIIEKNSNDFFNGIEAVRFDYTQNKAYVSVAFDANSNDIYLKIVDSNNNQVGTYNQIDKYYDNRQAAVAVTADDYWGIISTSDAQFDQCIDAFRQRHIWITPAIITEWAGIPADWTSIQRNLDEGYVEPASHSQTHPDVPFNNYDSEIGGSKSDIINNLNLPALNKRGSQEYIYAWIEPYGSSDNTERAKLGQYKYLVDRSTEVDYTSYSTWDSVNGLYRRIGATIEADDQSLTGWSPPFPGTEVLNSKFDSVVAAGGIYVIYFHPVGVKLTDLLPHLDYIKERTNIWYAGFGHLYEYDIAAKSIAVSTVTIPVASFTVSPTSGATDTTFTFTDTSSNSPTSWSWDFGDGGTANGQSATHKFTTAGTYNVILTATNGAGSSTATQSVVVSSVISKPIASFTVSRTSGTTYTTFTFTDTSSNSPTSWSWDFGDGGSASGQRVKHQFTTAGTYTVTLTATNDAGSSTATQSVVVRISKPVASFTVSPTSGTTHTTFTFTDTSSNSPTSWSWNFGDGGSASGQSVTHQFTKVKTYKVKLTATNGAGSSTAIQSVPVLRHL
jgi:PKD repeat protein